MGTTDASTPLLLAAYNGHLECCRLLLEANAEVRARTTSGDTPLHRAAMMGRHALAGNSRDPLFSLLIASKSDLFAKNGLGQTPLDIARENGLTLRGFDMLLSRDSTEDLS